jgi:hypothetical protein
VGKYKYSHTNGSSWHASFTGDAINSKFSVDILRKN